eukprot:TRINITY_DN1197_c0_g1_i1.p1 TRINITY_DN1197_c0_g1~~TRINITY_DN1197_c0_g1_i1.p1  ORF type:complete len:495 (+),score=118.86 TRINITY_DN1197_c0_g1_i1:91-1575(+)
MVELQILSKVYDDLQKIVSKNQFTFFIGLEIKNIPTILYYHTIDIDFKKKNPPSQNNIETKKIDTIESQFEPFRKYYPLNTKIIGISRHYDSQISPNIYFFGEDGRFYNFENTFIEFEVINKINLNVLYLIGNIYSIDSEKRIKYTNGSMNHLLMDALESTQTNINTLGSNTEENIIVGHIMENVVDCVFFERTYSVHFCLLLSKNNLKTKKFVKTLDTYLTEYLALACDTSFFYFDDQHKIPVNSELETIEKNHLFPSRFHLDFNIIEIETICRRLCNVHLSSKFDETMTHGIEGDYIYFHYKQDDENDIGWGCAYRSLQLLISYVVLNNKQLYHRFREFTNTPEMFCLNIKQIQELLVEIGDKDCSFIDSNQWIGSVECSFILQRLFDGSIECVLKYINFSDLNDVLDVIQLLQRHFSENHSPIMMASGQYAYTMLGINTNSRQNPQFLIADPHYVGKDIVENVVKGGGVRWVKRSFFAKDSNTTLCLFKLT